MAFYVTSVNGPFRGLSQTAVLKERALYHKRSLMSLWVWISFDNVGGGCMQRISNFETWCTLLKCKLLKVRNSLTVVSSVKCQVCLKDPLMLAMPCHRAAGKSLLMVLKIEGNLIASLPSLPPHIPSPSPRIWDSSVCMSHKLAFLVWDLLLSVNEGPGLPGW